MTRITNRLGLPLPLVKAVENDGYNNAGTYSATTLLKPAQAIALTRKHGHELVEDASDRIWALMGQGMHTVLERAAEGLGDDWIVERRFCAEMFGERVSGAADVIEVAAKTVWDYKQTSGWAVMAAQRDGKSEWRYQLSLLAALAREGRYLTRGVTGAWHELQGPPIEITHGKIVAVIRDWSAMQALRNRDFPQSQVAVIDMDILPDAEVRAWVGERLAQIKFAIDGGEVLCTDEERWKSDGKWSVTKRGNQKAAKLADTEDELSSWIFANRAKLGAAYDIEQRPTVYKRCAKYCAVSSHCPQHLSTPVAFEQE